MGLTSALRRDFRDDVGGPDFYRRKTLLSEGLWMPVVFGLSALELSVGRFGADWDAWADEDFVNIPQHTLLWPY